MLNPLLHICPPSLLLLTFQIPLGHSCPGSGHGESFHPSLRIKGYLTNLITNYPFYPNLQMKLGSCHVDVHVSICLNGSCIPGSNSAISGRVTSSFSLTLTLIDARLSFKERALQKLQIWQKSSLGLAGQKLAEH